MTVVTFCMTVVARGTIDLFLLGLMGDCVCSDGSSSVVFSGRFCMTGIYVRATSQDNSSNHISLTHFLGCLVPFVQWRVVA